MEHVVNAIVLRAVDYKDSDKMLTLYSLEKGKLSAGIKGVKKSGAKLKFASEPFCFAEYVLAEKSGRFTVIGASHLDSFYNLRLNMLKYYASAVVGEALNLFTPEKEQDVFLFNLSLSTVKEINYENQELLSLCKFLIGLNKNLGYEIAKTACHGCGEKIDGRVFFNPETAEFSCMSCRENGFMEITLETYKAYESLAFFENHEIETQSLIKLLKFLVFFIGYKTDVKLKSATALIDFLSNNND